MRGKLHVLGKFVFSGESGCVYRSDPRLSTGILVDPYDSVFDEVVDVQYS